MGAWLDPVAIVAGGEAVARGRPMAGVRPAARQASSAIVLACIVAGIAGGLAWARQELRARTETVPPVVVSIRIYELFIDDRPIPLTVTAGWTRVPHVATRDEVVGDVTLWRRMQVVDWDMVPGPLREQGLDAMLARHRAVLTTPALWDRMTAYDWDAIPQPVRALAFRHMLQYWTGYYHVGRAHGLAPHTVSETAAAIVMTESWFEHRAEHVNARGNRDLGLAQASDSARRHIATLYARGVSDVRLTDDDYFNPWAATRFVAIWLSLLLDELDGDLDTAVRAYHRGARAAARGEGHEYLELVRRRKRQYIRHESDSPAWRHLWHRDRELTRAAWPWLHSRRVLPGSQRSATALLDRPGDPSPTWWALSLAPAPAPPPRIAGR
jgi:hypothetical protein